MFFFERPLPHFLPLQRNCDSFNINMKTCSIIIASYNEAQNLKKCLESVQNTEYPKEYYETIVVDNNSTDNTREIVQQFSQVIYLQEHQKGASFARNTGIKQAKNEILVFLDADAFVSRNWLKNLTEPFDDESIGAVGGEIRPANEGNIISEYLSISLFMRYHRYGVKREIRGFPSCNLAVRKNLISEGFDTALFKTYGEDKDICYHIIEKGYKIIFQPGATAFHKHPDSLLSFLQLIKKSTAGRVAFSRKYRTSPDAILMRYHIPLIYLIAVSVAILKKQPSLLIILFFPVVLVFFLKGLTTFKYTRNFSLSFLIKPFLDIVSLYAIYFFYTIYGLLRLGGVSDRQPQKG